MRTLPFSKYSPGGNPTLLIPDMPLSATERAAAASELMGSLHLGAEQVGYVDTRQEPPRLDMMGGEFCINATRATAVHLARLGRLSRLNDGRMTGEVRASGVEKPLRVAVRSTAPQLFEAAVRLEQACPPATAEPEPGLRIVRVPGITHLILDERRFPLPGIPEERCAELRRRYRLQEEAAVGCIWVDPSGRLTPVVWVRDTDSICRETACGSGTLAAAVAGMLPFEQGGFRAIQPSGEILEVRFEETDHNAPWAAWISGPVRVLASGEAYVCVLE